MRKATFQCGDDGALQVQGGDFSRTFRRGSVIEDLDAVAGHAIERTRENGQRKERLIPVTWADALGADVSMFKVEAVSAEPAVFERASVARSRRGASGTAIEIARHEADVESTS